MTQDTGLPDPSEESLAWLLSKQVHSVLELECARVMTLAAERTLHMGM